MNKVKCKALIIALVLTSLVSGSIWAQDSEAIIPDASVYFDFLFNEYIVLETSILELIDAQEIGHDDIYAIDKMLAEAESENRSDVVSRLNMLRFVAETEIQRRELETNAEAVIAGITAEEAEFRAADSAGKIGRTAVKISIGTAIASGTVFAASALISEDYYRKYTETEYADQAAFYLFWWQFLDNVSLVSAVTAVVSSAAAGILSAIFLTVIFILKSLSQHRSSLPAADSDNNACCVRQIFPQDSRPALSSKPH